MLFIEVERKNKVVFFGACVADGYNLMTKFPVNSLEDFKGKKIVGAAAVAPLIKALGAAAVVGALPTFYSQLQTGVADGAVIHATGAWPLKLHEVVPHLTLVDTGPVTYGGAGMNADSFKRMPSDVQKVLRKLGRAYSASRLISWGVLPISAAAAGIAAEFVGVRTVFATGAVVSIGLLAAFLRAVSAERLETGTVIPEPEAEAA